MDWKDRENKLANALRNHEENLDTAELWKGIQPELPIQKKKNRTGLLLLLLVGMTLGFLFSNFLQKNTINSLKTNLDNSRSAYTSIELELKKCQQITSQHNQNFTNESPTFVTTLIPEKKSQKKVDKQKTNDSSFKGERTLGESPLDDKNELVSTQKVKQYDLPEVVEEWSFLDRISLKKVAFNSTTLKLKPSHKPFQKIPLRNNIAYYTSLYLGASLIQDQKISLEEKTSHNHAPLYSWAAEIGLQKRGGQRWFWNLAVMYQNNHSKINYDVTTKESLLITDTTSIIIDEAGLQQVTVGDVWATKIVRKKGVSYANTQSIALSPHLEFNLMAKKRNSLGLKLGVNFPLISWTKGSVLDAKKGLHTIQKQPTFFQNPSYTGGFIYHTILFDVPIGFLCQVIYGKQEITTNQHIYARNYWLPQAGMRLIF
ncbi:MAG: hypothetical protein WAT79_09530 [Saprospiraceae bacterium]